MIPRLNDLFENENEVYLLPARCDSTSRPCQCEKFSRSRIQSDMDRMKRKCYGVPSSISRFNPSRLLPLRTFKEHAGADLWSRGSRSREGPRVSEGPRPENCYRLFVESDGLKEHFQMWKEFLRELKTIYVQQFLKSK